MRHWPLRGRPWCVLTESRCPSQDLQLARPHCSLPLPTPAELTSSPSSQDFNEIMPTIYKRFTEKEAREWRQIYKALQLLEYLIKHGSERVIDDARSHISMIKILRSFHYIDDKGKDQGINGRSNPLLCRSSRRGAELDPGRQSATGQRRLPSCSRILTRSGPNGARPAPTGTSTPARATRSRPSAEADRPSRAEGRGTVASAARPSTAVPEAAAMTNVRTSHVAAH